jgi:hypothetical protein
MPMTGISSRPISQRSTSGCSGGRCRAGRISSPIRPTTQFWKNSRTSHMMPAKVATPNLIVAGWWDQEDFYGPMQIYANQEKGDAKGLNYLVVGPWNHGGWRGEGGSYGPYPLGGNRQLVQGQGRTALVPLLAEGRGQARPARGSGLPVGQQRLAEAQAMAAVDGATQPVPARRRQAFVRSAQGGRGER